MNFDLPLEELHRAAEHRPPGYVEDVLSRGTIKGDVLEISEEALEELKAKYRGPSGAGDIIAIFAKPIAGVIDAAFGTNLKNCGGCAERQKKLNDLLPL